MKCCVGSANGSGLSARRKTRRTALGASRATRNAQDGFAQTAMDLIATPKNPIPLGASVGYLEGQGRCAACAMRVGRRRSSSGTARSASFPGAPSSSRNISRWLASSGGEALPSPCSIGAARADLAGSCGNSLKGHVMRFADYEDDVTRFMNEVALPDCPPPYYALAHSMGATVLLKAATMRGCWFSRMVMTAPMLEDHRLADAGTRACRPRPPRFRSSALAGSRCPEA